MSRIMIVPLLMIVLVGCGQPAQPPAAASQPSPSAADKGSATSRPQAVPTAVPAPTTAPATAPATAAPPSPVAAVPAVAGPAITGVVSYPTQPALPPGAALTIALTNQSGCGVGGCPIVSTQVITTVGGGSTPFALAYAPAAIDPQQSYAVDAWISAPGRLRWQDEQPSLVLTQGHPATAEIALVPPPAVASISGTVSYPAQAALPPDATLEIRVANMGNAMALGALSARPVGSGPFSFTIEYDPASIDPQADYMAYAVLRAGVQVSFVSAPYPVITRGHGATVALALQAPTAAAAVSGTIAYHLDRRLPPDATLVIEVEGFTGDDVPSKVGEQVIAPVGSGPIAFAIPIDPAALEKQQLYQLHARIYDRRVAGSDGGATVLAAADQTVFAYTPIDLALKPSQ